jgi:hypothetical protein
MEVMLERFSIHEIAESICSAGFLPLDPFIGYRDGESVYVLEGNRRVATLQLLLKPELAPPRFARTWEDFRARLDDNALAKFQRIPVLVYPDRRDVGVLAYIGYRHVNGVLPWDAQEKAAYIAQLVEDNRINWSYKDIADRISFGRPDDTIEQPIRDNLIAWCKAKFEILKDEDAMSLAISQKKTARKERRKKARDASPKK